MTSHERAVATGAEVVGTPQGALGEIGLAASGIYLSPTTLELGDVVAATQSFAEGNPSDVGFAMRQHVTL